MSFILWKKTKRTFQPTQYNLDILTRVIFLFKLYMVNLLRILTKRYIYIYIYIFSTFDTTSLQVHVKSYLGLKSHTCRSTSGSNKSSRCWQSPGRTEKLCLLISARRFVLTRMESGVSTSISAHLVLFICPIR